MLGGTPSIHAAYGFPLKLTGVISGSPSQVTIKAGGAVEWSGSQGNTYTGIVKVDLSSELVLKKTAGQAVTGPVEMGGGKLTLGASNQIADTAPVWFSGNGVFNVNGYSETVLTVYGSVTAALVLGDGTLTLAGNSTNQLGSAAQQVRIQGSPLSSIHKKGTGTWTVYRGDYPVGGDQSTALYVEAGKVQLQVNWQGSIFLTGGTLEGNAITGSITNNGGTLNLTTLQPKGVTTPGTGGTLACNINSEVPGTGFGRLQVTGTVNLTGLTLNLALNYQPLNNETFTIIDNDSNDAVTGIFNGMPEGSTIYAGGQPFKITYKGGSGANDVVLLFTGIGAPDPQITLVRPQPDGTVRIDVSWQPSKTLTLERGVNGGLAQWTTAKSVTLDGQGKATVFVSAGGTKREFFRLRTN
ncbi:hypothetical protein [Luteolibacter soli]|uniref:Uncharacterized protein n=1 Tax=Luteolibacter soli TaxID=3135280 RepID=A0ABU9AUX0_9BACT